jgi:hypothetical protein
MRTSPHRFRAPLAVRGARRALPFVLGLAASGARAPGPRVSAVASPPALVNLFAPRCP